MGRDGVTKPTTCTTLRGYIWEGKMRLQLSLCAAVIGFGLIGPAVCAEEMTPATKAQIMPGVTRTVIQKTDYPGDQYATILFLVDIAPRATVGRHVHPGLESGYVLEGAGELSRGETGRY